ncbi:hypothetical protein H9P43_001981 [Blastocladiella emersonii ATCC 22665]|nr:hypothetical protein H9P43_001981 [Blastocladiella emersonii ATCC 22665]
MHPTDLEMDAGPLKGRRPQPVRYLIYLATLLLSLGYLGLNGYYLVQSASGRAANGDARSALPHDAEDARTLTGTEAGDQTLTTAVLALWCAVFAVNAAVVAWVAFRELVLRSTRTGIWYRTLQFAAVGILVASEVLTLSLLPPNFFPEAGTTALAWFIKDAILVGLAFAWYFTLPYSLDATASDTPAEAATGPRASTSSTAARRSRPSTDSATFGSDVGVSSAGSGLGRSRSAAPTSQVPLARSTRSMATTASTLYDPAAVLIIDPVSKKPTYASSPRSYASSSPRTLGTSPRSHGSMHRHSVLVLGGPHHSGSRSNPGTLSHGSVADEDGASTLVAASEFGTPPRSSGFPAAGARLQLIDEADSIASSTAAAPAAEAASLHVQWGEVSAADPPALHETDSSVAPPSLLSLGYLALNAYYVTLATSGRMANGRPRPDWDRDAVTARTITGTNDGDATVTTAVLALWCLLFAINAVVVAWVAHRELVKRSAQTGIWYRTVQFSQVFILLVSEVLVLALLPPNFFPEAGTTALLWFAKDAALGGLAFAWYFTIPYSLDPAALKAAALAEKPATAFTPASPNLANRSPSTISQPPSTLQRDPDTPLSRASTVVRSKSTAKGQRTTTTTASRSVRSSLYDPTTVMVIDPVTKKPVAASALSVARTRSSASASASVSSSSVSDATAVAGRHPSVIFLGRKPSTVGTPPAVEAGGSGPVSPSVVSDDGTTVVGMAPDTLVKIDEEVEPEPARSHVRFAKEEAHDGKPSSSPA